MADLNELEKLHKAYETFAKRFPILKKITCLIPDSIYKCDVRYASVQEENRRKISALENTTARLVEIRNELQKTQAELVRMQQALRKYEGIEERLQTYERIAEDMRRVILEDRKKIGEEAAKATIYHNAQNTDFGVALSANGIIIGASKRAVKLFGHTSERELQGTSFYEIVENSRQIRQILRNAVTSNTKTVRFDLSTKNKRKIGYVSARIFYNLESSSQQELIAVSIIETKAYKKSRRKEALARLKKMQEKNNPSMEKNNAIENINPLPA